MSDIFREVDEEIRHERYKRLWDRFGPYLIGLAVLIVVGTAAFRGWVYWRETQAQASGDVFVQAVRLAEDGKFAEAEARFGELADAPGGYPTLARLRVAGLQAQADDPAAALASFDAVAADSGVDNALRDIARLRAGYVALDTQDFAGAADRLEPLAGDDNALRFLAREALALGAWKAGNAQDARRWIAGILEQEGAPSDVATRAQTVLDLLNAAEGTPDDKADS
ncbi:tetratricopeptide repeat protein [Stappia stellulata]|uniref:tetratricopeptide repeat protein n=1 Tax=Stappia stellulata TaxID=71235 RepID=UPI0004104F55|nr:tetratricopeptide repeat protein [Stappia stellulata]